jgi:4-amino-4-deoxy-L-arabinose transferase-like glycosyltransferase
LRLPPVPLLALVLVSVLSLSARAAFLDDPCHAPCRSGRDHVLIFDEVYYVNAARAIAGVVPPAGQQYAGDPLGTDPNAEHPQLVKLVIAGAIELFGDGPFAWRVGSLVMGSLALLGIYALARAAGAGRWTAVVAATLMAGDNLLLVHGRIGTLDIYAAAAMIWTVALYLRGRSLAAGIVLAAGVASKEVAAYALVVLGLMELWRWWGTRTPSGCLRRLGACVSAAAVAFLALLAAMDRIAPPYDDATHRRLGGGLFGHLSHMISFAARQTSPHGPGGIASYPWGWLFDYRPIVYLNINPAEPAPGLRHIHPAVHFLGMISPPLLLAALPALVLAIRPGWAPGWLRPRLAGELADDWAVGEAARIGVVWVLGTLGPFLVLSVIWRRTSYLYYMVIVMPGIYLAVAGLVSRARDQRPMLVGWAALLLVAAVVMYPLFPLP